METTVDVRRASRWVAMALLAGGMLADVGAAATPTPQQRRKALFADAPVYQGKEPVGMGVDEPRSLPHRSHQPCRKARRSQERDGRQPAPQADLEGLHLGCGLQVEGFHLLLVLGRWLSPSGENRSPGKGQQQDQKQAEEKGCPFFHARARFSICGVPRYNVFMPRRKLYPDDETVSFTIRLPHAERDGAGR